MFLCDREFRENDERKGREEEKQRVGVATSSHLAPTVEYIFPRPLHLLLVLSVSLVGFPWSLPGEEGGHKWWDFLWDARSWVPSATFP